MYLHFHFHNLELKHSFPQEFGEVEANIVSDSQKINKNFYKYNNQDFFNGSNEAYIDNIKLINYFIGANNSGKSRFLRGIIKLSNEVSKEEKSLLTIYREISENTLLTLPHDIFSGLKKQFEILEMLFLNPHLRNKSREEYHVIKSAYEKELDSSSYSRDVRKLIPSAIEYIDLCLTYINMLDYNDNNLHKQTIYIPILRSLLTETGFSKDSFTNIIKMKYGLSQNVFTGLDLYDNVSELHLSADIIVLDEFSQWIRNNFYKDHNIRIIPDRKSSTVLLQIDDKLTPIHDLGDGVQQLILLMFPIFTARNHTWFYIEEPETHLHPGLQRLFIETLINDEYLKDKKLKFFFTTHSNHFLDLSIDHEEIAIFQFQKDLQGHFNIKSNCKPNKEILDLLGINTSSVFLSNTSIWVEGPTDRKYISKWLKLYCEKNGFPYLKEDIDFAFFEYGGNLIEHYLFDEKFDEDITENQVRDKIRSFALSNKIYLLANNDNVKEGSAKYERRKKLETISSKHFKYQNTEYREIENLLPANLIKQFLPQLISTGNANKINIERENYLKVGLGDFCNSILVEAKVIPRKFRAKSGTLKNVYKNKLCDFVVNANVNYADLIENNPQLDKIVADLYNFIKSK